MKTVAAPQAKPYLDHAEELVRRVGLPSGMGRLVGWLLIAEPACQTPPEIAKAVELPVEVVRQELEALVTAETLDRVEMPGRAEACFALKPIDQLLERRVRQIETMCQLIDEGLALPGQSPEVTDRLESFRGVYAQFIETLHELRKPKA